MHTISTHREAIAELTMLTHELNRKADGRTKVALEQSLTNTLDKWNSLNSDAERQHQAVAVSIPVKKSSNVLICFEPKS